MSTWFVIHWHLLFHSDTPFRPRRRSTLLNTKQKIEHLFHAPHHVTQSTITTSESYSTSQSLRSLDKNKSELKHDLTQLGKVKLREKNRRARRSDEKTRLKKMKKRYHYWQYRLHRNGEEAATAATTTEKRGDSKAKYRGRLSAWINESARQREERGEAEPNCVVCVECPKIS